MISRPKKLFSLYFSSVFHDGCKGDMRNDYMNVKNTKITRHEEKKEKVSSYFYNQNYSLNTSFTHIIYVSL